MIRNYWLGAVDRPHFKVVAILHHYPLLDGAIFILISIAFHPDTTAVMLATRNPPPNIRSVQDNGT
jgi:hypothetical protein